MGRHRGRSASISMAEQICGGGELWRVTAQHSRDGRGERALGDWEGEWIAPADVFSHKIQGASRARLPRLRAFLDLILLFFNNALGYFR